MVINTPAQRGILGSEFNKKEKEWLLGVGEEVEGDGRPDDFLHV